MIKYHQFVEENEKHCWTVTKEREKKNCTHYIKFYF